MKSIKLVLGGSGTLYPVYIGAIQALNRLDFHIEEICGVSGGSIISGLIASGYSLYDIQEIIYKTLPGPNNLIDYSWWPFDNFGFIKGEKIEKIFAKYLVKQFKDTKIPLSIISVNLNRRRKEIFSTEGTPNISLSEVIRASLAIPGIFKGKVINGDIYVDGGIVDNFPLDIFGNHDNVVGIRIDNEDFCASQPRFSINSVKEFMLSIAESIFAENFRENQSDANKAKIITLKVSEKTIDFGMDKEQCSSIIRQGYDSVLESLCI